MIIKSIIIIIGEGIIFKPVSFPFDNNVSLQTLRKNEWIPSYINIYLHFIHPRDTDELLA
jgi:hypothetical protein